MFRSILKEKASSSNKLIIGDPEGSVAIVTLWSKASEMAKKLDPSRYCIIGQLFSAERGLDLLVRNLLANPQITTLIVTGVDFSKSGIVLEDFFRNGFERGETRLTRMPVWKVRSAFEGYLGLDIPAEALEELRQSLVVQRVSDAAALDFSSFPRPEKTRVQRVYEKREEEVRAYVGEYTGHLVRGRTVAEAWLHALDTILKFGRESETHYDEPQRELLNLLSVIEEEDPHRLFIPDYLPCDGARVKAYVPRITRDLPGGIHKNEYTYGSRMRSWFGTDQVKRAVDKLAREPISRAVVIGLWDPAKDLEIGGSPCLNHLWLRISGGRLHLTALFRSHDMFEGYPENAFGLRALQEEIRQELQSRLGQALGLGELMILSQSAHLYRDTWEWADKITREQLPTFRRPLGRLDPRGNFVITIEGGNIVVEHTGPGGEKIGEYRGRSGAELCSRLVRENVISLPAHALDLGLELMKAETALRLGIPYVQDNQLPLPSLQQPAALLPGNAQQQPADTPTAPGRRELKDGLLSPEREQQNYGKILRDAHLYSGGF